MSRAWWTRRRTTPPAPPASGDQEAGLELPWRHHWDHLPKRSAGFGYSDRDYRRARGRAEQVAEMTLGTTLWRQVRREGYLDLPSTHFPGITYRLRIGQRIEVVAAPGARQPWRHPYLCINPAYPLPEAEFFAHLYLYVRDREAEVIRVAAPQPWDQALGRTF
ncbi:MAG: hypothetical protein M3462_09495 [Chloroflexota bacterium]|nr:hypothetical protein [Chloroflexota bacterium]